MPLGPSPNHDAFPGSIATLEEEIARRKMKITQLYAEFRHPAAADLEGEVRAMEAQLAAMKKADDAKIDSSDNVRADGGFREFMEGELGGKWVVGRNTEKLRERYPDHKIISQGEMSRLKERFKKKDPSGYAAYFGRNDNDSGVRADDAGPRLDPTHRAAGILFKVAGNDGPALFLKRGPGGDYPGYWCFPGGHVEGNETPEEAAVREAIEEVGSLPKGVRVPLARNISIQELAPPGAAADGAARSEVALPSSAAPEAPLLPAKVVDFTTFLQEVAAPFDVVKDGEHVGFAWAPLSAPPEPLHPGCAIAARRFFADELGIARMMAAGELTSPQVYQNVTLWAMRITGTGVSYRRPVFKTDAKGIVVLGEDKKPILESEEEFPWRDPSIYLNDEFLARCNGLPVIAGHPKGKTLNSKEFDRRVVGTIFLPFIRGDEVWGIAKVFDDDSNVELAKEQYSTSPAVVLSDPANPSYKFRLEDGSLLLVEGKPSLLDHLAICERGVWDKGGDPSGIDRVYADSAGPEDYRNLARALSYTAIIAKCFARA